MAIRVRVLYFGQARDASGVAEESRSLPDRVKLRDALEELYSRRPALRRMSASLQVAVNEEIAEGDPRLSEGDVIAILPPVAGG